MGNEFLCECLLLPCTPYFTQNNVDTHVYQNLYRISLLSHYITLQKLKLDFFFQFFRNAILCDAMTHCQKISTWPENIQNSNIESQSLTTRCKSQIEDLRNSLSELTLDDNFCNNLEDDESQELCESLIFINDYPEFTQLLSSALDSNEICSVLNNLADSQDLQFIGNKCALCNGVVNFALMLLRHPALYDNIQKRLTRMCPLLSRFFRNQACCEENIKTISEGILNFIQNLNSQRVCSAFALCPRENYKIIDYEMKNIDF